MKEEEETKEEVKPKVKKEATDSKKNVKIAKRELHLSVKTDTSLLRGGRFEEAIQITSSKGRRYKTYQIRV